MSEMIERVARAIAASDEPHEPWENWAERHKDTFRASARAAIEAVRAHFVQCAARDSEQAYYAAVEEIDAALSKIGA